MKFRNFNFIYIKNQKVKIKKNKMKKFNNSWYFLKEQK